MIAVASPGTLHQLLSSDIETVCPSIIAITFDQFIRNILIMNLLILVTSKYDNMMADLYVTNP